MRILLVSEDIPYANMGGLAKHVLTLARALVRAGHQVDLLGGSQHPLEVAGREAQFGGHFFGELSGHLAGWKERRLGLLLPPKRPWIARHFARIILRHAADYDVIHYHGHVPNVASHIPAHVNFVQTRHDQGADCIMHTRFRHNAICNEVDPRACAGCVNAQPNLLQQSISGYAVQRFRTEVARGLQRHKTIFVSDMLRLNLCRTLGPGPWGITVHHFADLEQIDAARAAGKPPPQDQHLHVMVAGKINPAKGTEAFLRTLAPRLPQKMQVTIVGDGPCEARLRREFSGVAQFHFTGWCNREQTLQMTAAAHAVVVPSLWEEPFGSTVMEGLLLGKSTFALARGGTPEMASYAMAADQLRLHPDMPTLVQDLVSHRVFPDFGAPPAGIGGAQQVMNQLLTIYRLPPGRVTASRAP